MGLATSLDVGPPSTLQTHGPACARHMRTCYWFRTARIATKTIRSFRIEVIDPTPRGQSQQPEPTRLGCFRSISQGNLQDITPRLERFVRQVDSVFIPPQSARYMPLRAISVLATCPDDATPWLPLRAGTQKVPAYYYYYQCYYYFYCHYYHYCYSAHSLPFFLGFLFSRPPPVRLCTARVGSTKTC